MPMTKQTLFEQEIEILTDKHTISGMLSELREYCGRQAFKHRANGKHATADRWRKQAVELHNLPIYI